MRRIVIIADIFADLLVRKALTIPGGAVVRADRAAVKIIGPRLVKLQSQVNLNHTVQ